MSPALGDPTSLSALAATLRRSSLALRADGERIRQALDDASPGWSGPTGTRTRRRIDLVTTSLEDVARALDDSAHALQTSATRLAEVIAGIRSVEEEAERYGLVVRDGTVERAWGITGVADPSGHVDAERARESLQESLLRLVTALGRHRSRLAADVELATHRLADTSALLRS